MSAFFVYILQNPAGRLYVGQTSDLEARLGDHNGAGWSRGKLTRKNGRSKLAWSGHHGFSANSSLRGRTIAAAPTPSGAVRIFLRGRAFWM
jgi:predicted GIY-YIG superfamily endonuclease